MYFFKVKNEENLWVGENAGYPFYTDSIKQVVTFSKMEDALKWAAHFRNSEWYKNSNDWILCDYITIDHYEVYDFGAGRLLT